MSTSETLLKTPLYFEHLAANARLVPFSGFEMPVQYSGLLDEHLCVRKQVGLFDVSHMGIARCEGADALQFLNETLTRDLATLDVGRAAYTLLCTESGGTLDDLIVYREGPQHFFLVLNASNKHKDFAHFQMLSKNYGDVKLFSLFDSHSLLALQGPHAESVLKNMGFTQGLLAPFSFIKTSLDGIPVHLAFTGYTGEKGCEIFVENSQAAPLWQKIMKVGAPHGLKPIGLGARDTLRTEMGYSLYGHELSEEINPIEAGLAWAVGLKKLKFIGLEALQKAKANPKRKIVCLANNGKQAPRQGMSIFDAANSLVGHITSGTYSPSLGHVIGMGLIDSAAQGPFTVEIRGTRIAFENTTRPFLKNTGLTLAK